jgi:hypothetical protein
MSKHNLDLLIEAARLLKPLLGELVTKMAKGAPLLLAIDSDSVIEKDYSVSVLKLEFGGGR